MDVTMHSSLCVSHLSLKLSGEDEGRHQIGAPPSAFHRLMPIYSSFLLSPSLLSPQVTFRCAGEGMACSDRHSVPS